MWLNYPHMPTGASATKEGFQKAIAFAKKHESSLFMTIPIALS